MRGLHIIVCYIIIGTSGSFLQNIRKRTKTLECNVSIVGGGISGLYMAYEILKDTSNSKNVCILEKEGVLGGRIRDYRFKEAPDINIGLGAWRIDMKQHLILDLLKQLNISTKETVDFFKPKFFKSRGIISNSTDDIKEGYPALKAHKKFGNMTRLELWNYVLKPQNVAQAKNYSTIYTYLSHMITSEGANFLLDTSTAKGSLQDFVSPIHWKDLLIVYRTYLSGKYVRPDGGMSMIIKRLKEKVITLGGKIYTNTEVQTIAKKDSIYVLLTPNININAEKVVLAVPPSQFVHLKGTVAKKIQQTAQFQSMRPIPVFRGVAVYRTPWWEKVNNKAFLKAGQHFYSSDYCLGTNTAERGYGPQGEGVLYTIYTDGDCAKRWKQISDLQNNSYLEFEMHKALEATFEVKISKPIATKYQYWDSAWYYQKSGTPLTMTDVSNWAKRPFPDEDIFLIGSSYNPMRAFSEGALLSCRRALKEVWKNKKKVESSDYKMYRIRHQKTIVNNILKFLKSRIVSSKIKGPENRNLY